MMQIWNISKCEVLIKLREKFNLIVKKNILPTARFHSLPNHTPVWYFHISHLSYHIIHQFDTFLQCLFRSEHSRIILHHFLQLETKCSSWDFTVSVSNLVEVGERCFSCVGWEGFVRGVGFEGFGNVVGTSSAKDNNVEEWIGAETIGTVYGYTCGFACSIKTGDYMFISFLRFVKEFAHIT